MALRKKGCEVRSSNEPRRSLAMALGDPPGLILLDYVMPERNGLDVLKDLRSSPDLERVPVIMFTAASNSDLVSGAMSWRVNDFFVKPFSIKLLLERLGKNLPPPAQKVEPPPAPPTEVKRKKNNKEKTKSA